MSSDKEKKGWFSSLTRRKKSQSQNSINLSATTFYNDESELLRTSTAASCSSVIQSNNNNTIGTTAEENSNASSSCNVASGSGRKRKEEKNAFQRFRKKMGLRFSLRGRKSLPDGDGATTDASSEFTTTSPIHEPLKFNFKRNLTTEDADVSTPFSNDFKRFIKKKWLEREDGPNWIMYGASCEMLK